MCFVWSHCDYPLAMGLGRMVVRIVMKLSIERAHTQTVPVLVYVLYFDCRLFPTRLSAIISQIVKPERDDSIFFANDKHYISRDHRSIRWESCRR